MKDSIVGTAPKVEIDFSDDAMTGVAGNHFVARTASVLGLPELLHSTLRLKKRARGACDAEMILSTVYSLAAGDGALADVDRLRADDARRETLGLARVPSSRRLGEYFARFGDRDVQTLLAIARVIAANVAPAVVEHLIATQGRAAVFIDGSAIEVDGQYVEGAKTGYSGEKQLWLHSVFVGSLWASQRLWPGAVDVCEGWREQLEADVLPLLPHGTPVWLRGDNAYYRKGVVDACRKNGWDYSVSVTSGTYKKPLRWEVAQLDDRDFTWINDDHTEEAAVIRHQPHGWSHEESYIVIRTFWDGDQRLLRPRFIFILVSRTDEPLDVIVRRHRQKQGQENAQKGPLIDLDLHHPPCQGLQANRAFYVCGQLAQMLLIAVQYKLLPAKARCHGLRTLIRDVVRTCARLVRHGRKLVLRFAKSALRLDWIACAADRLDTLARAAPG